MLIYFRGSIQNEKTYMFTVQGDAKENEKKLLQIYFKELLLGNKQ